MYEYNLVLHYPNTFPNKAFTVTKVGEAFKIFSVKIFNICTYIRKEL